jgi:hypothetical protein
MPAHRLRPDLLRIEAGRLDHHPCVPGCAIAPRHAAPWLRAAASKAVVSAIRSHAGRWVTDGRERELGVRP